MPSPWKSKVLPKEVQISLLLSITLGKMDQSMKCWLPKHKDLKFTPRKHVEKAGMETCAYHLSTGGQKQEDPHLV